MKNINFILYMLIIVFTITMPIIPSTSHIKVISLTGDTILYIIVLYFLLILIFDRNVRDGIFKNFTSFFKDYINIYMMVWILTMFVSVIYSRDKLLAFSESIRLFSYVFLFFILKYYINEEKVYKYILKSYMLSSFIIGVFGIYQRLLGIGTLKTSKFGSGIRISSFLENSNNLGMYFVFAIFPFIILFIKDKEMKNKIVYLILTILSLANIIFSYSRNALIGFTIGIVILIVILGIKYIFLTTIPILLLYCMPTVSTRVKDISDMSQNLSRIQIWKLAVLIIKDHPIFGVGNGNYTYYLHDYVSNADYIKYNLANIFHPHNAFLKAFSELGLLGILSFTGIIVSSFSIVYKFIKKQNDNFYSWFYTGVFISLFSMLFMNLIDNFFSAPKVIVYYFILLGVCEGIKFRQISKSC